MEAKESKCSYGELFMVSLTALFVELLVIRWMSADIRAFIIFRTFPLVSCFVGFGAGFARKDDRLFKFSTVLLLVFVILMKVSEVAGIDFWQFPSISVFQWQNLVLGDNSILFLAKFIAVLTVLLAGPFLLSMSIASRLGVAFSQLPPLKAYAVDLLGSFCGSLLFGGLCYLQLAPWKLAALAAVPLFYLTYRQGKLVLPSLICLALVPLAGMYTPDQTAVPLASKLLGYQVQAGQTLWSPYQRIDVNVYGNNHNNQQQFLGLELCANRAFYQYYLNDEVPIDQLPKDLQQIYSERRKLYQLPFSLGPAKDVLVVGAGTGQNVAAALANGAESVDAVDIDPVILQLGKQYNPSMRSPKVHLICDDARHYFRKTNKKYDLIVFTMLDSQAVVGSGSSVRLDAYVYTRESMQQALQLLRPKGNIAVAFAVFKPWIAERFVRILSDAAGYTPLVLANFDQSSWRPVTYFILGDRAVSASATALPQGWKPISINVPPGTRTLTDDWPYLYVRPDVVDYPYLLVVSEILIISLLLGRKLLFARSDGRDWQMFLLGAGFLLLELHAISFLSLLYGSTWITSAVVINSILLMIMLANLLVMKWTNYLSTRQSTLYALLLISITCSYFLPSHQILSSLPNFAGYAVVTLITMLPMFVAGLIFPTAFSLHPDSARALGFNLFGCLMGGLLEYLSSYWGIRSLELVAAALYGLSFLSVIVKLPAKQSIMAESTV